MSRPCVMQGGMRRLHRRDALSLSIRPLEIMEERTQGDRGLRDMVEVAVIEEEDRGGMEEEEEEEEDGSEVAFGLYWMRSIVFVRNSVVCENDAK